jgi:hypothetical protein
MSRYIAPQQLATMHLVLSALVLLWNLFVAGRTARLREVPRSVALLSAIAGLLLVPALLVLLLSGSELTGRALTSIGWIWPLIVTLVATQAILALARGLVAAPIGFTIAVYDVLIALIAAAQYAMSLGLVVDPPLVGLVAAQRSAIAFSAQPLAPLTPWFLFLPILSPASPGRRGLGATLRTTVVILAAAWGTLIILAVPSSTRAVRSYTRYATERLQERPDSDFVVGLKVFPTRAPDVPPTLVHNDLALADSMGARALSIYLAPRGATTSALDILAREIDLARGDKRIIVALDLSREPIAPTSTRARFLRDRVGDAERIARVLRPDYVVPVVDPNGAATRQLGDIPHELWTAYLRDAAVAVHRASPKVRVMAHVGGVGSRDSALYAWATSAGSPIDAVALSLTPSLGGANALDARLRAADSWLATARPRDLWILEAGGLPLVHGATSQARAIWGALAWATRRPAVKGFIVFESGDYGASLGLRSPSGRLRPAAMMVRAAVEALQQ